MAAIVTENIMSVTGHGERRRTSPIALPTEQAKIGSIVSESNCQPGKNKENALRPSPHNAGTMVAKLSRVFEDPRDCDDDKKPVFVMAEEPSGEDFVQPKVVDRSPSCNAARETVGLDRAQVRYNNCRETIFGRIKTKYRPDSRSGNFNF